MILLLSNQALRGGHLECVQVCSAAGAERFAIHVPSKRVWTATEFAGHKGHDAVVAWLNRSHDWMELHHLETLTVMRTLALLRGGASLEVKSEKGDTPVSIAQQLRKRGEAPPKSPAELVLRAAEPWSPHTDTLWPTPARVRALELLCIGKQLSRKSRFRGEAAGFLDVWHAIVVPMAICRDRSA